MSKNTPADLVDQSGRNSTDPKHAPVPLPAGSYEMDQLQDHLEKAVKAKPEERDAAVQAAFVAGAAEGTVLDRVEGSAQRGFRTVPVENKELGITENVQVFDPELDAEIREADAERAAEIATTDAQAKASADATTKATGQSKGE